MTNSLACITFKINSFLTYVEDGFLWNFICYQQIPVGLEAKGSKEEEGWGQRKDPANIVTLSVGSPTGPGNAPRALTPTYVSASEVGREGPVEVTATGGRWQLLLPTAPVPRVPRAILVEVGHL